MLTSGERRITGVDCDSSKINIAKHGYLKNDNISFIEADVAEYPVTPKDGFLLGDVLHYLPYEKQKSLLQKCIRNLKPGGMILIREGNTEKETRHKVTKFTEFFSTKVLVFNKTTEKDGKLFFTSSQELREIASENGLTFEVIDQKRMTSNSFFVMRLPMKDNSIHI
jgi:2-polyprenyl-3-methyl-5-hydroxy-6-metoxy-1,4-benzoquinol methylase